MEFADLRRWELTDREWSVYLKRADAILTLLKPAQREG
jgi:hypothetical protein